MAILDSLGGRLFNIAFGSAQLVCCCQIGSSGCCTSAGTPFFALSGFAQKIFTNNENYMATEYDGSIRFIYDPQSYVAVYGGPFSPCSNYISGYQESFVVRSGLLLRSQLAGTASPHDSCAESCQLSDNLVNSRHLYTSGQIGLPIGNNNYVGIQLQSLIPLYNRNYNCTGYVFNGDLVDIPSSIGYACSGGTISNNCIKYSMISGIRVGTYGILGLRSKFVFSSGYSSVGAGKIPLMINFQSSFIYNPKNGLLSYFYNCQGNRCPNTLCTCYDIFTRCKNVTINSLSFTPLNNGLFISGYRVQSDHTINYEDSMTLTPVGAYRYIIDMTYRVTSGIVPCVTTIGELV